MTMQIATTQSVVKRLVVKHALAAGVLVLASYCGSAWSADDQGRNERRAAIDLIVARPLGVVATALGAVVFVVGLPFSVLVGGVRASAQSLVVGPARETFARCLGCVNAGRLQAGESSR